MQHLGRKDIDAHAHQVALGGFFHVINNAGIAIIDYDSQVNFDRLFIVQRFLSIEYDIIFEQGKVIRQLFNFLIGPGIILMPPNIQPVSFE